MRAPVRLGAAENTLIAQLQAAGAQGEAERLSLSGLPTRRVETYHYTDLKMLLRSVPPLAGPANDAGAPARVNPGPKPVRQVYRRNQP
jgi:Fe-S cluster assembly protein SufD